MTQDTTTTPDWSPETYARFRGLRMRPALDLMARVPDLPAGDIVDLGCGNGAVAGALMARFSRPVHGVDNSPAMLQAAHATGDYASLAEADIEVWSPDTAPALIFSNAVFQWVPDHPVHFSRLAGALAPGGTLAVQMPRQFNAPSHSLLRSLSQQLFPGMFDFSDWIAPVATPVDYLNALGHLGRMDVWETQYIQQPEPVDDGHPVRAFTQSTAMRPFLERLDPDQAAEFIAAYDRALDSAYPVSAGGKTFMPFRRLFFTLTV